MTARRKRLKLNNAELVHLGTFLCSAGCSGLLGAEGRDAMERARERWQLMDSVARAAVIRLGLKPQLTALGCIPE